ncbi:hypothetical protein ABT188_19940, partial [Streptomyces violaceorubidus]
MARTVLVVTALEDVTAGWVVTALNQREVPVVRVDPADIGSGLTVMIAVAPSGGLTPGLTGASAVLGWICRP